MTEPAKKAQEDSARFQAAAEQWREDFERWECERKALIDLVLTEESTRGRSYMRIMMTMIAMLILTVTCTEAHDIYTGLKDHLGESSCCNETDCRPAHYRVTAAGVDMLLDDEWVRVPNDIIQYRRLNGDTGETNGGHCSAAPNFLAYHFRPDHPPSTHSS